MPTLYKLRGFTPTDSAITLYTHKLWHRRYFLNREVGPTILATIQHNWQCISWLIIDSTKEFHVDRYENISKQDGCI